MIQLFINNREVELSQDTDWNFNYQNIDTKEPTAIKNPFTKTVEIQGTPNNNEIFGCYYDVRANSTTFNPKKRVPFILKDNGNLIEKGYCKLDKVNKKGQASQIVYSVTLYGILGDCFYNLMMNEDTGEERKLSDLTLGLEDCNGNKLDEDNGLLLEWNNDYIYSSWLDVMDRSKEKYLNNVFVPAPTYNGYHDEFASNKALVNINALTNETKAYLTSVTQNYRGYCSVEFSRDLQEFEIRDLRSNYQRCAVRNKVLLDAMCNPENNGGYDIVFDDDIVKDTTFSHYYTDSYTLMPQFNWDDIKEENYNLHNELELASELVLDRNTTATTVQLQDTNGNTTFDLTNYLDPYVHITYNPRVYWEEYERFPDIDRYFVTTDKLHNGYMYFGGYAFRLVAKQGTYNKLVGKWNVCLNGRYYPGQNSPYAYQYYIEDIDRRFSNALNCREGEIKYIYNHMKYNKAAKFFQSDINLELKLGETGELQTENNMSFYVEVRFVQLTNNPTTSRLANLQICENSRYSMPESMSPIMDDYDLKMNATNMENSFYRNSWVDEDVQVMSMTKKALLSPIDASPYDFLISFCKLFDLRFLPEDATNTIKIVPRYKYYVDDVVDISDQIDYGDDYEINPHLNDKKYYLFRLPMGDETYADKMYNRVSSLEYGARKYDTLYQFNKETDDIYEDNIFNNSIPYMHKSLFFNPRVEHPLVYSPTFELTQYVQTGVALDNQFSSDTKTVNGVMHKVRLQKAVDSPKVCLFDSDNKSVNNMCIVFLDGTITFNKPYTLTDNIPMMSKLVGDMCYYVAETSDWGWYDDNVEDKLCWFVYTLPVFSKYLTRDNKYILSLDFDMPKSTFIRDEEKYDYKSTIYYQCWMGYLEDLYHADTKEVTVMMKGIESPREMMRRFYYFDGSLWTLNQITDYSLNPNKMHKCSFVKVQDKYNYLRVYGADPQ